MDSKTVPELKALAKNLGLRGYSRLRKAELINLINQNLPRGVDNTPVTRPIPAPRTKRKPIQPPIPAPRLIVPVKKQPPSLFGKVPEINVPILKPTVVTTTPNELPNVIQKTTENVIDWGEWLKNADEAIEKHNSKAFDATKNEIMSMFSKPQHNKPTFTQRAQALKGYTISYEVGLTNTLDPLIQLQSTRLVIENNLKKVLNDMKGFKFNEVLKITFEKQKGDELIEKTAYFNGKVQTIINDKEIVISVLKLQNQIINKIQQWVSEGSGWTVQSVDGHFINVVKYQPLKGSSYIPLPKELQNSAKGIINIKNNDDECFRWCHIRFLFPQKKDPQRVKECDRRCVKDLDYTGIEFPVFIKQYNRIEKQNSINVNVFGYEQGQPYPIYISKEKFESCLNLLLITEEEVKHYCLIKDFNKFMYNQTKHKERKHFCMYCLQCFSSEEILTKHKVTCIEINGMQSIKMPEPGTKISFRNYSKQLPAPFVIYADFEAITEKIPNLDKKSNTEQYQKHIDCGYGYKVVCCYDDEFSKPIKIYRGEKAVYKFMEDMLEEVKYC